jgi:alkylation response protein AidB-like acyl-CoA dehydrogenase
MHDQGKPDSKRAAAAAWFASKIDLTVIDQALQIHGGYGYVKESDIERIYRDGTVAANLSGINDMEKIFVAHHLLGL